MLSLSSSVVSAWLLGLAMVLAVEGELVQHADDYLGSYIFCSLGIVTTHWKITSDSGEL